MNIVHVTERKLGTTSCDKRFNISHAAAQNDWREQLISVCSRRDLSQRKRL